MVRTRLTEASIALSALILLIPHIKKQFVYALSLKSKLCCETYLGAVTKVLLNCLSLTSKCVHGLLEIDVESLQILSSLSQRVTVNLSTNLELGNVSGLQCSVTLILLVHTRLGGGASVKIRVRFGELDEVER